MADGQPERYDEVEYHYTREYFNPVKGLLTPTREEALAGGDRPQKSPYLYDEEIILAVNTALASHRPLLVAGAKVRPGADLGIRKTFADLGQTLADVFGVGPLKHGRSFLAEITT